MKMGFTIHTGFLFENEPNEETGMRNLQLISCVDGKLHGASLVHMHIACATKNESRQSDTILSVLFFTVVQVSRRRCGGYHGLMGVRGSIIKEKVKVAPSHCSLYPLRNCVEYKMRGLAVVAFMAFFSFLLQTSLALLSSSRNSFLVLFDMEFLVLLDM